MTHYANDIEFITENNTDYRRVLFTTCNMQLVVMSLLPREEIGEEIHEYTTQFIRIEKGSARILIGSNEYIIESGGAVIVPPNTLHNVSNESYDSPLKLYTIYSPPEHPRHTIEPLKN